MLVKYVLSMLNKHILILVLVKVFVGFHWYKIRNQYFWSDRYLLSV